MATILDVKNILVSFFLKNDILSVDRHTELFKLDQNPDVAKKMVFFAAKDFEAQGMLKALNDDTFVLIMPLQKHQQTVVIGAETASQIADLLNNYRQVNNIPGLASSKLAISEDDILNLLYICHDLLTDPVGDGIEEEGEEDDEN